MAIKESESVSFNVLDVVADYLAENHVDDECMDVIMFAPMDKDKFFDNEQGYQEALSDA